MPYRQQIVRNLYQAQLVDWNSQGRNVKFPSVSTYACSIVGLDHPEGTAYVPARVRIGDLVALRHEPGNPSAVAAYFGDTKVGYLLAEKRWIWSVLDKYDQYRATVVGEISDIEGKLVGLDVEFAVIAASGPRIPAPGTAPMAPRVSVPQKRTLVRLITSVGVMIACFATMAIPSL